MASLYNTKSLGKAQDNMATNPLTDSADTIQVNNFVRPSKGRKNAKPGSVKKQ